MKQNNIENDFKQLVKEIAEKIEKARDLLDRGYGIRRADLNQKTLDYIDEINNGLNTDGWSHSSWCQ